MQNTAEGLRRPERLWFSWKFFFCFHFTVNGDPYKASNSLETSFDEDLNELQGVLESLRKDSCDGDKSDVKNEKSLYSLSMGAEEYANILAKEISQVKRIRCLMH